MIDHDNYEEAPPMPKGEMKSLPLNCCYLADKYYQVLVDHGVTDFTQVKAISCVKNPNPKDFCNFDDYFITTVTHVATEDGRPKTFAFYEFRPNWLDPTVPWHRLEDNFGAGFGSYMELAHRHGIPIAFYFKDSRGREESELEEIKEMEEEGDENGEVCP